MNVIVSKAHLNRLGSTPDPKLEPGKFSPFYLTDKGWTVAKVTSSFGNGQSIYLDVYDLFCDSMKTAKKRAKELNEGKQDKQLQYIDRPTWDD